MRYVPYENEYSDVQTMTQQERLEYFLTRVFECEEVWMLCDKDGEKYSHQQEQGQPLPAWPYLQYAREAMDTNAHHCQPEAESLEDFVYETLEHLASERALLDLMPTPGKSGAHISAGQLQSILLGLMESGEYSLDC